MRCWNETRRKRKHPVVLRRSRQAISVGHPQRTVRVRKTARTSDQVRRGARLPAREIRLSDLRSGRLAVYKCLLRVYQAGREKKKGDCTLSQTNAPKCRFTCTRAQLLCLAQFARARSNTYAVSNPARQSRGTSSTTTRIAKPPRGVAGHVHRSITAGTTSALAPRLRFVAYWRGKSLAGYSATSESTT